MKTVTFKFEIGEIVNINGVLCKVLESELHESALDYLCLPLDINVMVLGQWELGSGWVFQHNIKKIGA